MRIPRSSRQISLLALALAFSIGACAPKKAESPTDAPRTTRSGAGEQDPSPQGGENQAPTADLLQVNTGINTPLSITLTGSDLDEDPITFRVIRQPDNGTLTGNAPNLTYTPNNGFEGFDAFDFVVNDGQIDSNAAPVLITVGDPPPEAFPAELTTGLNEALEVELTGADAGGNDLTFTVVTQPRNGALTGQAPNLTYTPNNGFEGIDAFTFRVNNGDLDSVAATISITVGDVNQNPVATLQQLITAQDTPLDITLSGFDANGDDLTFTVIRQPDSGTLSGNAPDLTYTPDNGFVGQDSFDFIANDGDTDSNAAPILITVGDVAPEAFSQELTTGLNEALDLVLGGVDQGGDDLTFTVVTQPSNGALTGQAPNLTYTPGNGFVGVDSFTFRVNDGQTDSAPATVSIAVGELGQPPFAASQSVSTSANTPIGITLEGNDPEGADLTFEIIDPPDNGTLSGDAPDLTYTPDNGFNGIDNFSFRVDDGQLTSSVATVTISVGEVNLAPVAFPQDLQTAPDEAVAITLTGDDPEGAQLTFEIVDSPDNGALSGQAPNITYTPGNGFEGADSFTFRVNDGAQDSEPVTISIAVGIFNTAPVANPQNLSTTLNTPIEITLTASDEDGDDLSFEIISQPVNGQLSGQAPNLTYTPDNGFRGSDLITFRANDGEDPSAIVSVFLQVGIDNLPPIASAFNGITEVNTPTLITLEGSDPEGAGLTFEIVTQPANGQLSGQAPNLTYTPNQDFNGAETFTFRVNDGIDDSEPGQVLIVVGQLNQAPFAIDQEVVTGENEAVDFTLTAGDPDGDDISFEFIDGPDNGALSGTAPDLTYTPDNGFNGVDTFTYRVSDGQDFSEIAEVSIIAGVPNVPPTALSQDVSTNEGVPVDILLEGDDLEGAQLTFGITRQPDNGTIIGSPPSITYTPGNGFTGIDTFDFIVNDGEDDSDVATVFIFIGINVPPEADLQQINLDEDTQVDITLTGSDVEGSPLTFTIVVEPENGQLSGDVPDLTYTPNENFSGFDTFDFKVNDGVQDSNTATIVLIVGAINDAPIASDLNLTTNEETAQNFELPGVDPDGDLLLFEIIAQPDNGVLSGVAPNLIYTPNANFNGNDSFLWQATDGLEDSEIAQVTINVVNVNDAPTVSPISRTTDEDTPVSITLQGQDLDDDDLSFTVLTAPASGALSGSPPDLTYTPNGEFSGSDSFTYRASDGLVISEPATVSITVVPVNDPPIALEAFARTEAGQPVSITLQGRDAEGAQLTFRVATQPANGSLAGQAPNITYTPDNGFDGDDTFTFVANDGQSDSEPATVFIQVDPVDAPNQAPTADNLAFEGDEDAVLEFTLEGDDPDGDPLVFEVLTTPQQGTIQGVAPDLTYTPPAEFSGEVSFTFRVSDGLESSAPATVTITINDVNDPPVVFEQVINTIENLAVSFSLLGEDPEGDDITFEVLTQPNRGTLSGQVPDLTYTPDLDFGGDDTFTFRASDGEGFSEIGTMTLRVAPINDPPTAFDQAVEVDEDNPLAFELGADDPDNPEALIFIVINTPQNGQISGNAPELVYTPNPNFNGEETLTFLVNDGQSNSEIATVTITVNSVNDAPIAEDLDVETEANTPVDLQVVFSDPDDVDLTFEIIEGPNNGQVTGQAPNLTYTPDNGFGGDDAFTFSVSDGDLSATGTVSIFVSNQDLPAPVLVLDTEEIWHNAQTRLEGRVTDSTCLSPPIAQANPGDLQLAVIEDNDGFRIQSQLLPEGIHALNIRAESRCSLLGTNASISFGIDATAPLIAFQAIPQDGVVEEDPGTWPVVSPDAPLDTNALLRDTLSGLDRVGAALVAVDRDDETFDLHEEAFEARFGRPARGLQTTAASLCSDETLCDAGRLDLSALSPEDGEAFILVIDLDDTAGNSAELRVHFVVGRLRPAIVAWRQILDTAETDDEGADALRLDAIDSLDQALQGLDNNQPGNMLLSLEEAGAADTDAHLFDDQLPDTTSASLTVAALAHSAFEARLEGLRRDNGPLVEFNPAGVSLDLARAHIELDAPSDAFLALAGAFFWMERGATPMVALDFPGAQALTGLILSQLGAYLDNDPTLAGAATLATVQDNLDAIKTDLDTIEAQGPEALTPDQHFALAISFRQVFEDLAVAQEEGAWVRNWIWGLTEVIFVVHAHNFELFGLRVGVDHPVLLLSIAQLDAADEIRDSESIDEVIDLAFFSSHCLLIGLDSLVEAPPTAPDYCCADLLAAEALDEDVLVPRACNP